jgi:diguanylate cyclase (GGDEF)-like protein/PAS domain S-box-containing protein
VTVSRNVVTGLDFPPNSSSIWQPRWQDGRVRDAVLTAVNEEHPGKRGAPGQGWVIGQLLSEVVPGATDDGRLELFSRTAETGQPFLVTRPGGGEVPATVLSGQRLSDGKLMVQMRDVDAGELRSLRLDAVNQRWERIFEGAALGISVTNFQGILLEVNRTLCTMLGRRSDELVGHAFNEFTHPDDPTRLDRARALATGRASMDKRYLTSTGDTICLRLSASLIVENGEQLLLSICEDITAEVAAKEALRYQATTDEVTGLWNRAASRTELRHRLEEVTSGATGCVSLLLLDLDRFKVVNNSLGHAAGDVILAEVAVRLKQEVPDGGVIGRTGGDEFVVILPGVEDGRNIAARLQRSLRSSVRVGRREVAVGASIGIATARPGGVAPEHPEVSLLRDADTALQVAKRAGPGEIVVFDDQLRQSAIAQLDDEQDLRLALSRGELTLHFQPIRGVQSDSGCEFEALVRWEHPTRGLLSPDQFLGVAEVTGLIVPLGRHVLDLACRQLAIWRRSDPTIRMAVNVAAEHLRAGTLAGDVVDALRRYGLPASALTLEVTEQTLVDSHTDAAAALSELRDAGSRIAIDDFGTGYSSLAYLRDLPVDILKIDRVFIAGLGTPANDGRLLGAILALGRSLGLETVAEGIETEAELAAVTSAGVTYVQGYLISRPAAAEGAITACS